MPAKERVLAVDDNPTNLLVVDAASVVIDELVDLYENNDVAEVLELATQ